MPRYTAVLLLAFLFVSPPPAPSQAQEYSPAVRARARFNTGHSLMVLRALGKYRHAMFCAAVEEAGFFAAPVPQGIDPVQAGPYAQAERKAECAPLAYVPEMSEGARLLPLNACEVGRLFAPDHAGKVEPFNADYRPRAPGTATCMCWSRARGELLTMCPESLDRTPAHGGSHGR